MVLSLAVPNHQALPSLKYVVYAQDQTAMLPIPSTHIVTVYPFSYELLYVFRICRDYIFILLMQS